MLESHIQQLIQIEAMKLNCNLMRNNSGAFTDQTGRHIRFGLGNVSKKHSEHIKSSDLIGITTVTVTPQMIGKTLGIFTAIEVKAPGWKRATTNKHEEAQANFIEWVLSRGGFAGFTQSLDDLNKILRR